MLEDLNLESEQDYPYEGVKRECRSDPRKKVANLPDFMTWSNVDAVSLMHGLYKYGPIAVLVDASSNSFKNYKSGVYYNSNCLETKEKLKHAMLLVGYGVDPKEGKFWILVSDH